MSSELKVTEPSAVKLLLQPRTRKVLGAFLNTDNTVSDAAKQLGLDIRLVHRDVLALLTAGLLKLQREQQRAGRPIKIYRAVAPALFVPLSATSAADIAELGGRSYTRYDELFHRASHQEFERLHHEQGGGREWGVRLYTNPEGQVIADQCYENAEHIDAGVRWQGPLGLMLDIRADVRLTDAEAQAVQIELVKLLMRLRPDAVQHEQDGTGRPFLLRLGLIGVTDEDLAGLR